MVVYQPQLSPRARIRNSIASDEQDGRLFSWLLGGRMDTLSVYGRTDPLQDHFQRHLLPLVCNMLATTAPGVNVEVDLVRHAILAMTAFHQALFVGADMHMLDQALRHLRRAHADLTTVRTVLGDSKTEIGLCATHLFAVLLSTDVQLYNRTGISLLNLAHSFGGLQVILQPSDLSGVLNSRFGYEAYDVLCVHCTLLALAKGFNTTHTVSSAGAPEIEQTFGIGRSMWWLYGRLTAILAYARLEGNGGTQMLPAIEPYARVLMVESTQSLSIIESTRPERIAQGSKVGSGI